MYEGFSIWSLLAGLPLGLFIIGIVFYTSWRRGKKERRFDERYTIIQQEARSISWMTTSFAILIIWVIVQIIEKPGLAFWILTILWVVHMTSYAVGTAIASKRN